MIKGLDGWWGDDEDGGEGAKRKDGLIVEMRWWVDRGDDCGKDEEVMNKGGYDGEGCVEELGCGFVVAVADYGGEDVD